MNKKKLHLNAETIRRLSQEDLSGAAGGNTAYCTIITRCMFSCPCEQTDGCEGTYTCGDTCQASCWQSCGC